MSVPADRRFASFVPRSVHSRGRKINRAAPNVERLPTDMRAPSCVSGADQCARSLFPISRVRISPDSQSIRYTIAMIKKMIDHASSHL